MATTKKPSQKQAKATLVLPKSLVIGIQTADPSTGKSKGVALPDASLNHLNKSINSLRTESDVYAQMRNLVIFSGDMSMAVASYLRLADAPLKYRVYDPTHQLSDQGSLLLRTLLNNLKFPTDYTYGYDDRHTPEDVSGICLREVLLTGGCALELVLNKAKLPDRLQPVSPSKLKWRAAENTATGVLTQKIIPWQQAVGQNIILDIPTFFFARLDTDPTTIYPKPPFEAAINTAIFHAEVLEDIRKVVKRSGHSRLILTINHEKLMLSCPMDVRGDPAKEQEWVESVRSSLSSSLAGMNPETALILFDNITADYLNSEIGGTADYTAFKSMVDAQMATALHTPLTILAKPSSDGSSNIASSESLLFLKHAAGIRKPVETLFSRALTLAVRLLGFEGYVEAYYPPIDLRPESELEAYRAMKQARILELWSLGTMADQEASEELGTGMLPPTFKPLSGTQFYNQSSSNQLGMDAKAVANGGDPAREPLSGNTPTKAGGKSQ
jgi:hypothetical protein